MAISWRRGIADVEYAVHKFLIDMTVLLLEPDGQPTGPPLYNQMQHTG